MECGWVQAEDQCVIINFLENLVEDPLETFEIRQKIPGKKFHLAADHPVYSLQFIPFEQFSN